MGRNFFVHPTADVSPQASIGEGTKIWLHCQMREGVVLGRNCILKTRDEVIAQFRQS